MDGYSSVDVVYFTIQHRVARRSPWLAPDGKLKPVRSDWVLSSWDYFGDRAFDPLIGKGNNKHPRYRDSHGDCEKLRRESNRRGWKKAKHALQALRRVRKMDDRGEFDCWDGYGNRCQAARHEFRIVKVRYVYLVEEFNEGEQRG